MIHDEIRSLLDSPPDGEDAPTIDAIEHTLTAGYARALALEAERWRLERRIAQVAAELGGKSQEDEHSELTQLGQRLSLADGDLSNLRGLLSSLRSSRGRGPGNRLTSTPASDAAEFLGREHQARGRTRSQPRLDSLGKNEGGLWRRVIAGQKPASIAGRGTN